MDASKQGWGALLFQIPDTTACTGDLWPGSMLYKVSNDLEAEALLKAMKIFNLIVGEHPCTFLLMISLNNSLVIRGIAVIY